MLSRSVVFLEGVLRRTGLLSWQGALLAVAWLASLLASPLAAVAVALTLSWLWGPLWRGGKALRRALAARPWAPFVEGLLVLLAFSALGWGCLGFVIREHIPIDRGDHHIMIARAELLTRALREGYVAHWSHLFQGGDSLTDLYPVFLNWLTALIHLASPAGTAFVDSYSRFCIAAWVFRGFAAYLVARRFAGPLPSLVISAASLFDVGSEVSDGTWHGVFYWGMIHNNFALSLGLLALAFQIDLTRRVSASGLLRCSLFVALASIAHPLGMLLCTVSVAALSGATVMRAKRWRRPLWALGASVLGLMSAGVWLSPYVRALSVHGFNGAVQGIDYAELGRGLLNGAAPISSFGAWIGFALVALCCSLGSHKVPRLAVGLVGIAFLLLAITPFMVQSRALEWFKSFLEAQERRCLTVAKVALIPSLAWLLQHLFNSLARRTPGAGARSLVGRALLIGLMVFGPGRALARGVDAVGKDLRDQFPAPTPSKYGAKENDTNDTYRAVYRWIAEKRKADPSSTPWRMTFFDRWDPRMFVHWTWVQGMSTGVPLVDFGWMSANFIRYRPRELTEQGMLDWNIRYAVSISGRAVVPGFKRVHEVGPYRVFEFENYDDRFVVAPEGVKISGLKVTDQRIEFDVAGAPSAGTNVTVRCAWFPRWQASQGGGELVVRAVAPHVGALPGQEQLGVTVKNGHVVIDSNRSMPGFWVGIFVSLLGVVGTAVAMRQNLRARLEARVRWLMQVVVGRAARLKDRVKLRRPRLTLVVASAALLLLLALSLPGARLLLQPAVEGVGMQVHASRGDGRALQCVPFALQGRYICEDGTSVEATFGITPTPDHAGEFGKFWPGSRLRQKPGVGLVLRFPRVDARSGKLRLTSTVVSGAVSVVVRTAKGDSAPLTLAGNQVQDVQLPAGLSRSESLEVRVSSGSGAGDTILRGELLP